MGVNGRQSPASSSLASSRAGDLVCANAFPHIARLVLIECALEARSRLKRLDLTNCIVTMPDRDAAPAVVLYGGLRSLEGEWFLTHNKIPPALLQNLYFIMPTHFTNKCKD